MQDPKNPPGHKDDADKLRPSLVLFGFSRALDAVTEVAEYGAKKYTADGWVSVPDGERRYTDALLRHLLDEAMGRTCDPESGLLHAAHAAWNALARLDLYCRRMEREVVRVFREVQKEQQGSPNA